MPATTDSLHRALELARFAPSAHNTQPWQVVREGERLSVLRDDARHLAHGDPLRRDQTLGLGAFCESLRIAATLEGIGLEPDEARDGAFATFCLAATEAKAERELASLLRRRQTSRLPYSPREPAAKDVEALVAKAKSVGLGLHLVPRGTDEREKLHRWLGAASRESWLDARAVRELAGWVRFDPEGARPPEDGLSTHCLGLSVVDAAGLKVLGRTEIWRALEAVYAAPMLAEKLAALDVGQAEEAAFFGLLTGPGASATTGAAMLQVWLEATRLGLALHPMSVLLDRRGWELARHLGVATGELLFAFRLGHSVPAPRSGRRPVDAFARL